MTRAAVFAAVLLMASLAVSPSASAEPVPLRVATYNIRAGAGEDGVFRLARTAAAIRDLHADVVGLQEVDVHWGSRSGFADEAGELARRLGMRVFFAPIYDLAPGAVGGPRRQFGVALLSRYPLVHTVNHEITRLSTQEPHAVPALRSGFAEATVASPRTAVHVYVTHLDYRPDPATRRAEVGDMLRFLRAEHGPRVLVGDFNTTPRAPELAALWSSVRDADPHGGDTYPADIPARRIDLVTVSPEVVVRDAHPVATTASDHRPVVADLAIRGRGR
jgi:endonuclease/exonuclease/phosphatase family metal-dependent hydrolase